ncbi:MAG: hypothetical protein LJE91_18305 [Gammaproteobacteria bacterium]|nr:hypothetical protein [Gammaproteobacteria bacterium]
MGHPTAEPGSGKQKQDSLGAQFTLIDWNMRKGRRGGWADDLVTHRGSGDLIVLQGSVPHRRTARTAGTRKLPLETRHGVSPEGDRRRGARYLQGLEYVG